MLTVESEEATVADARGLAEQYVADRCPWADLDAVRLVVTELVTNAVRHTSGWWRLTVSAATEGIRIDVRDKSPRPVRRRSGALDGSGGWGLMLAERAASRLDVLPQRQGKTVRAQWLPVTDTETADA